MRNEYFPAGLPSDIVERFDGFLDDAEGLENIKHPGFDDLIANLVEDVASYEGDLGEHGHGTTEPRAGLGCNLQPGTNCDSGEAQRKATGCLKSKSNSKAPVVRCRGFGLLAPILLPFAA